MCIKIYLPRYVYCYTIYQIPSCSSCYGNLTYMKKLHSEAMD